MDFGSTLTFFVPIKEKRKKVAPFLRAIRTARAVLRAEVPLAELLKSWRLNMTTFLFWNLHRTVPADTVAALAKQHGVDVVILAESHHDPSILVSALNVTRTEYHFAPTIGCERIQIYTRFSPDFLTLAEETPRLTVRRLELPGLTNVLLAAVHMVDKRSVKEESQQYELADLSRLIRDVEAQERLNRTVLVGDFNVNPFEPGMIAAQGLHAVMSRQTALENERTVQAKSFPFFYNPMWSLFGDHPSGPPGTYHYRSSESVCYFWNMFDQVLLRPSLLGMFRNEDLRILTDVGQTSLLSPRSGTPRKSVSDHLPILFRLSL